MSTRPRPRPRTLYLPVPLRSAELVPLQRRPLATVRAHPVRRRSPWPRRAGLALIAGRALLALAAVSALGGALWLVVQGAIWLWEAVTAWVAANKWKISAGLVGLVLIWSLAAKATGSPCPGLHCGGCGGR